MSVGEDEGGGVGTDLGSPGQMNPGGVWQEYAGTAEAGIWRAGWHFGCHRSVHLLMGGGGGYLPREWAGGRGHVCARKRIFLLFMGPVES